MIQTIALISIIVFTIILIFIGYYYRHKRIPEDFFMAGRKAGMIRIASSIFTLFGAGEIVTLTAFAYLYGISGLSLFLGIVLGFFIMVVLVKRVRKDAEKYKPYTQTDYLKHFLGPKSEKMSLILSLIATGSLFLIQLIVGGLLLSTLTGLSYVASVIIIGVVIAIYLTLGGFNSVLTTDVLQAFSMIIFIVFLLILYNPSGSSLTQIISNTQGIIPPVDFIVLFILGIFAVVGGTDLYQRVYAARSDNESKKGLILAGILWLVFGILMLFLGLKIFSQFPLADPNNAFFEFLASGLSTTILTLLSIFIVASLFSTADTELFLSSIIIGKLILGKKKLSSFTSQLLIWVIVFIGIQIAIFTTALVDIYFALLFAFMIMGPVMLARLFNRGNDTIGFIGMLSSLILAVIMGAFNLTTGLYPLILVIPPALSFLVPAQKKIS